MAKFVVDLSPEHRAKLDALRAEMGLRSEADALRFIIMFGHPIPHEPVAQVLAAITKRVYSTSVLAEERPAPPTSKTAYGSRLKKR